MSVNYSLSIGLLIQVSCAVMIVVPVSWVSSDNLWRYLGSMRSHDPCSNPQQTTVPGAGQFADGARETAEILNHSLHKI